MKLWVKSRMWPDLQSAVKRITLLTRESLRLATQLSTGKTMRLRDENKRRLIVQTAVKLFSEQPFHKVRLDDVAEAAGVGKGTVYIYFKNKEELYYSLIFEGFAEMVDRMHTQVQSIRIGWIWSKLRTIVSGMVDYGIRQPQVFEVLRTVGVPDATSSWDIKRKAAGGPDRKSHPGWNCRRRVC